MTAVLLALASAALFGAMTVAIRLGLRGRRGGRGGAGDDPPALVVALIAAAFRPAVDGAWPFLLAGLLAPGASQILFTLAIHETGASRTSVTVGAAPLVAVAIALVFLGEPVSAPLIARRARDRGGRRAARRRARCGPSICASDRPVVRGDRRGAVRHPRQPRAGAARARDAGDRGRRDAPRRGGRRGGSGHGVRPPARELARLAPAGVLFGLSYVCLFEAYFHGRVTVVSPLVATESLWGVALSALLIGRTEHVGPRLVARRRARRRRRRR